MSTTLRRSTIEISDGSIHLIESGRADAEPILFLHGWPEDSSAWTGVMEQAGETHHCIAVDLPGIGGSSLAVPRGDKAYLATLVHELITRMGLRDVTLVGHDAGGMVAFAYLKQYQDLRRAVIMNTAIPGISPWEAVLTNPYVWHFAFHAIPALPETLVSHDIRAYFDYFYEAITPNPERITGEARRRYVNSYADPAALTQGFELYRTLPQDAADNTHTTEPIDTPTLYLRGAHEGGTLADYEHGLRTAGLTCLSTSVTRDSGHFSPEEQPELVWQAIAEHLATT